MLYTFAELVKKANEELVAAGFDDEISERSVRHYTRVKALRPGRKLSELDSEERRWVQEKIAGSSRPSGIVAHDMALPDEDESPSSSGGELKGNIRFYRREDVDQLVALKIALLNGKTLEDLGYRSPERSFESGMRSMSPAMSPAYNKLLDWMPAASPDADLEATPTGRAFETVVARAASPDVLPRAENSWTLRLTDDLTLTGRGEEPAPDAVRALLTVVREKFPATPPPPDVTSEDLVIEIELADICAPFRGAVVNASNDDLTMGGGASGSVWRNCGEDALDKSIAVAVARAGRPRRLQPGEAIWSDPGEGKRLGFTGVIHAHGPRWTSPPRDPATGEIHARHGEIEALKRTWRAVLKTAEANGQRAIAAPLISTGLFSFPTPEGFEIAIETLFDTPSQVRLVVLRTFSQKAFAQLVDIRRTALEDRGRL